ncbi:Uncharacterized protein YhaN [Rhodoblastus acidophilus]|uniref:Uncharacterized protein YhaN n=1 Tax=Rhodoblastus acidophilus TaxID=1074 RepID=A0A212QX91_RHOAC|nr:YhaN family protein [Rhodoblastus acidophilus]PPQ40647.1 hypothetical protein CKO16_02620 [Rhodoblastus acidophilus]SNB64332.1 Uncharacterized protein YhaN [Rhodoblastus acidophilus]
MRLIELTLDAYGPFVGDRSAKLQFDPAARLHIVHGPNEAGKSSALRAIGDLFYGVPRSEKNFLRPADLRLGATVEARNGQTLQFFRQRGVKATLRDATGAALPDDCLAPFLGAATRDIFERAFGLNAETLREGGHEMLRSEGEIGASLFAAASGLRGLIDLRKGIEAEADEIFGERKAGRRSFYQALTRYDEANKAERDARLSEGALKALRRQIEDADAQLERIKTADAEEAAEQRRLQRLLKATPILAALAALRGESARFADLAAYSDAWAEQLDALLAARDAAQAQARAAVDARELAAEELAQAQCDAALLARADDIEALAGEAGAERTRLEEQPRREAALQASVDKLRARAFACGFDDIAALRAASPDAATLLRAEQLIGDGLKLAARKQEPLETLAREKEELANLKAQLGDDPPDVSALQEKFAALGAVEAEEAAQAELSEACAREARQLDERRARLSPPLPDLDVFARAPLPDEAALAQAEQALDALTRRRDEARRQEEAARDAEAQAQARLRALETSGPVPSRDDLRALRGERDACWLALAQARDDARLFQARAETFAALQRQADALADALIGDAARVAEAEAERQAVAAASAALQAARALLELIEQEARALTEAWTQAWAPCGVAPAAPRAMARWRDEALQLLAARETLAAKIAKRDAQAARLQVLAAGLAALEKEAGLEPLPLPLGQQARRIAARLQDLSRAREAARATATRIKLAPPRIAALEERLAKLEQDETVWRADFVAALAALGLDAEASFEQAQARIALWRGLPGEWDNHSQIERRVTSINQEHVAFAERVRLLLANCAPDLAGLPPLDAASALQRRLTAERQRATTRANAEARCAKAHKAVAAAQEQAAQAEARLAQHGAQAGFSGDAALLSGRLRERRALAARIQAESERLALVADGAEEAQLAEQARDFDAAAAHERLNALGGALESRKLQGQEFFAAKRAAQTRLAELDEGCGAEQAAFDREAAKADMAVEARRWAVLKIAALMVSAGLERHSQNRQDPLLARAGAIYAALTCGRYAGLKQDFGEDEKLQLIVCRADGAELTLGALSEGASDQLYLALRLAYLEKYAEGNEAPPFIGDDLFASFDDARVAAGLTTLAQLSPTLQPVLFTHHAHVAEIATRALGESAQILRLG